jgi:hypothetical protein
MIGNAIPTIFALDRRAMSDHGLPGDAALDPVTGAVPALAPGAEEAEPSASSAEHGYGSLLGLNGRKRKKTPVIILDAAEAEAAARQFQIVAAQDFAQADKPARGPALAGLSAMRVPGEACSAPDTREEDWENDFTADRVADLEPFDPELGFAENEWSPEACGPAETWDQAAEEFDARCPLQLTPDEFEDAMTSDAEADFAGPFACEAEVSDPCTERDAPDATFESGETGSIEAIADIPGLQVPDCDPAPARHSSPHHSARAQLVQQLPQRTAAPDRLFAILARLGAWLKRIWKANRRRFRGWRS